MKMCLIFSLLLCISLSNAQTVVPVGAGSYASSIPTSEGSYDANFISANVNVSDTNTRPIPTSDWWTDVLFNDFAGNLWAYPITIDPEDYGFECYFPTTFANGDAQLYDPIEVKAAGFAPQKNTAVDWSDWSVTIDLIDNDQSMRMTLAHGVPFTWVETANMNPEFEFVTGGATFFGDAQQTITLPYTSDHIGIQYRGRTYSIHAPDNTTFSGNSDGLVANYGGGDGFFVIGVLPDQSHLSTMNSYAYSKPTKTQVDYTYAPEQGSLKTNWQIDTRNLKTNQNTPVIQGFLPHQYRDSQLDFSFESFDYQVHHGLLKCAIGNSFEFTHQFNGVLPHLPLPEIQDVANPYDPAKMKTIFDNYAEDAGNYGADSYWGGKDLIRMAKYTLIAKQMDDPAYEAMYQKAQNALSDWFTYSPGEGDHYFARMDNWGAMVGFNPSYGSEQFTDNHFHYGYHTYAAAMLAMTEPSFGEQYGEMATLAAKQYANWDRSDDAFPFMRTFDPWLGHSYAGGKSSGNGNNQESTSEAMQSWAGVFLLGEALQDDDMRAAGAFGYFYESRATQEYWFDWKNETFDQTNYQDDIVGILFNGGRGYGTWFSGRPLHIYGIQWLPWGPIHNYMAQDRDHAAFLYQSMMTEEGNPADEAAAFGDDWANVVFGYEQMFDPGHVAERLDAYYAGDHAMIKTYPTGGLTYYYTHSNRGLGEIQWDHHISIPTSASYKNATTGIISYVVYNTHDSAEEAVVYESDNEVMTFTVPANTLVVAHPNPQLEAILVSSDASVVETGGEMQFIAQGVDGSGIQFELNDVEWTVSGGGTINANGLFSAGNSPAYPIIVTASSEGVSGEKTIRIGESPQLVSLNVTPDFVKMNTGAQATFDVLGLDQYGDEYDLTDLEWSVDEGSFIGDSFQAPHTPGAFEITATLGDVSQRVLAIVRSAPNINLALNKPVTASSTAGGNVANEVNDGNAATRWESQHDDDEWILIDLERNYELTRIVLDWEGAHSENYEIEVSEDGVSFMSAYANSNSNGGNQSIDLTATGRYVRLHCIERATGWGNSLYEIEAYGVPAQGDVIATQSLIIPSQATLKQGEQLQYAAYFFDDDFNCAEVVSVWSTEGTNSIETTGLLTAGSVSGSFEVLLTSGSLLSEANFEVTSETYVDCNGDANGTAEYDICGECSGGNTGIAINDCIIGLEETYVNLISIYPNPTSGTVKISSECKWKVISVLGQELTRGQGSRVDLSSFQNGVYHLIANGQRFAVIKSE